MNAYVAEVTGVPGEVPFELVVFERSGENVSIVVRGMTSSTDAELVCYETTRRFSISVIGIESHGRVRPFELQEMVAVSEGQIVAVHGLGVVHSVVGSSLPEGLPVVWGADPRLAGLSGDFLHQRGDRYVLMTGDATYTNAQAAKVA